MHSNFNGNTIQLRSSEGNVAKAIKGNLTNHTYITIKIQFRVMKKPRVAYFCLFNVKTKSQVLKESKLIFKSLQHSNAGQSRFYSWI